MNKEIPTREVEFDVEFTLQGELNDARGFMLLFTQNDLYEEDFAESDLGYRNDYEGVGVYIFRNEMRNNKWHVMTL